MTTAGDLMVGGSSGAPSRKAAGGDWQKLNSLAGVPVWIGPERIPLMPSGRDWRDGRHQLQLPHARGWTAWAVILRANLFFSSKAEG